VRVEIISIGTELINGRVTDTNAQFLAKEIKKLGYTVKLITRVGDDDTYIETVLAESMARSDMIISTGGLGVTNDDLTKRCISKVINSKLVLNAKVLGSIKKRFEQSQVSMPISEQKQALVPRRCILIPNKHGTAPGFICQENEALLICLPGVPREMTQMWSEEVVPFLIEKYGQTDRKVGLLARTCGLMEVEVNDLLAGIAVQDGLSITLMIRNGGVDIEFFLLPNKHQSVEMRSSQLRMEIEKILGPSLYTWGESAMEEVVGDLLKEKCMTLAVAESCTGGLISHRLTQVPGSSAYFERGVVTYSNRSKQELLDVKSKTLEQFGAVSSNVALEMAMGIREKSGTDIGLSVTGIAGPEGGSAEKPVGLVYCGLASRKEYYAHSFKFQGSREVIKMKSTLACLNMLRQYLVKGSVQ
jgi:nicotinamide-nucleotide amidase